MDVCCILPLVALQAANSSRWNLHTCQLGVGHHVVYGRGELEHLPLGAFDLDVVICF